jgi:hypothetical protein
MKMPAPGKIKKISQQYGEPAIDLVLRLLNEYGSLPKVARELDMDTSSLFRFVDGQKIKKQPARWVKEE